MYNNINHNSNLYLHLDASMQDLSKNIHGQRNSNYIYRLDSRANGYECNLFFSPQLDVMLSRVLMAKPTDLKHTRVNLTFATDLTGHQFDMIKIPRNPNQIKSLRKILLNLTEGVNFHHNWKQTVDFQALTNILSTNGVKDSTLRVFDTVYKKQGLSSAVSKIVKTIGLDKAKKLIPQSYKITNLACFWLDGFESMKRELDARGLTHENFSAMNFANKDYRKFEK